jgi:hypothetical protein
MVPAEVEIVDVARRLRMPQQSIQYQGPGSREYGILIPECGECANAFSLSTRAETATSIRDSRTSGSYSVTRQRVLSNIHQLLG